jgi:surface antigen
LKEVNMSVLILAVALCAWTAPSGQPWPVLPFDQPDFAPWGTYVGSFQAVPGYSNGSTGYLGPDDTYGYRYQCVEWVNRFYVQMFAHVNMVHNGNANQYYDNYVQLGLDRYPNGGTEPPEPGDIICSDGGDYGHIAVIRAVGTNSVTVVQQNWYEDSRDSALVLGMSTGGGYYTVSSFSPSYPVQGWLRIRDLSPYIHHVEDDWPECTRYGTPGYWHSHTFIPTSQPNGSDSSIGVCRSHMYWTQGNGNARDNYAEWRPNLLQSGLYDVYAFVPSRLATTRNAHYAIHHMSGVNTITVNQWNYSGVFVLLGQFPFDPGTTGYVMLSDSTGATNDTIGFDDIAFVWRESLPTALAESRAAGLQGRQVMHLFADRVQIGFPAVVKTAIVLDASGRVVKHLTGSTGPAGSLFEWDGSDADGRAVPAGCYACVATVDRRPVVTKLMKVGR